MRIISLNLNGIRAAERKGFFQWLDKQNADFVCLQETRAQVHQIQAKAFWPTGYYCYYKDAQKKGYSGVALYSIKQPDLIIDTLNWPLINNEGRFIEAQLGNLSVISLYMPSGSSGETRQTIKFDFLARFKVFLDACIESGRNYVICGDWNIAHKKIDIKNWRSNQNHSGFLPEERAWMDELFGTNQWVDAFRTVNDEANQYTWWSNRGQAWKNNVGWRIDYQVVTLSLGNLARTTHIYKDARFSDHAPLIIDYDYTP